MEVTVDIRGVGEVGAFARALASDQIPFATSKAINWTALDFQRAERAHMEEIFTIRRKSFMRQSVKIKPFATKTKLEAKVAIDSPGGRSDIFAKFETDSIKGPFRGRSVAVPTDAVPRTGAGIIRKGWRPSQLFQNTSQHGQGRVFRQRGNVYVGAKNTLLIRKPGGRGTIFLRQRGGDLVALYQLVPFVRISPDLEFIETAQKTVDRTWADNFSRAFDAAVGSAR